MSDSAESALDKQYPQPCPFCAIAAAYIPTSSTKREQPSPDAVPEKPDVAKVNPSCFLVLSAPQVLAFLDILPMTRGHLLVTTRTHRKKLADMEAEEGRDIGFWLPILAKVVSKVTGVSDYNIVQNNGARAAQVVPHVHFHIIPRPPHVPELKNKSWTMFGRGQRDDLDDVEGETLAEALRKELKHEIERVLEERTDPQRTPKL